MKTTIYCKPTDKGIHTFYLVIEGKEYYLFRQNYRRGVNEYFRYGVNVDQSIDFSRAKNDNALIKTMTKLPVHIKYIEKNYGLEVLKSTVKRNLKMRNGKCCA